MLCAPSPSSSLGLAGSLTSEGQPSGVAAPLLNGGGRRLAALIGSLPRSDMVRIGSPKSEVPLVVIGWAGVRNVEVAEGPDEAGMEATS